MIHFPFSEYWWFYLAFSAFILVVLFLDLGILNPKPKEISFKESLFWSLGWVSLALLFNYFFYRYALHKFTQDPSLGIEAGTLLAKTLSLEFLTGYLVEKTLAIDNIFVFIVVFSYFSIPRIYQHRILFWGILGALVSRAILVGVGSVLMQYEGVVWFFGGLLILTGFKMMFSRQDSQSLDKNLILRFLKKYLRITPDLHGSSFVVKHQGKLYATPLLVVLIFLELTDVVFAVDSVPAIFSLTKEPLIVFTSNILAVLGLRSLFFMLSEVIGRFSLIKYGLALVLIFVGLKMVFLNHFFGGKFPVTWSLGIIAGLITVSMIASVLKDRLISKKVPGDF